MAEPVLKLGLIGIGSGARGLLEAFVAHPGIKLVAAADTRQDALDKFAGEYGAKTYNSAEALCSDPNVDAVWVATPNHFHAEHVIIAAEHKKHVVVSKPMAVSLEQCQAMVAATDKNGVKLLAGHTQSMLPGVTRLAELVRSGDYGPLGMLHSWNYTPWIYRPRMPEELDATKGGGVVFRQSPHHIDIVRLIGGGMVRSVRAMTLLLDPSRPVPGAFVAYLEFENGVPATIIYSGYGHFDSAELTFGLGGFTSPGRGAVLVGSGLTNEEEQALKEAARYSARSANQPPPPVFGDKDVPSTPFGLTIASCTKADLRQSPKGVYIYGEQGARTEVPVQGPVPRGYAELDELYQGVVNGKPIVHDGRWGLATQEVTMAILQSAQERREIMMQHQVAFPG
ncbi:MAG: Gfo/Idh/MocA family oxidoreductase [Dehalococcoidia bacterium]|nr:Gfo/Idh/MocA family oxidoreductase [Dehalococcoidia bacterium]